MLRCPEPEELMNDAKQVQAYAEANFEDSHALQVDFLKSWLPSLKAGTSILDMGCGSGDITVRLARLYTQSTIDAVDGSTMMLKHARHLIEQAGLTTRVRLLQHTLPSQALPTKEYALFVSNNMLHHLHAPNVFWQAMRQTTTPACAVFITDLFRPTTEQAARECVERYAGNEPSILQRDFYNSLLAAWTPQELAQQLVEHGVRGLSIKKISDRHMAIYGNLST